MWQANDAKQTGLRFLEDSVNRRKKAKDKKPLRSTLPIHLHRIEAKLRTYTPFNEAMGFLPVRFVFTDLSPKGVLLFSKTPLELNQLVALSVDQPLNFFIRGKVIASQLIRDNRLTRTGESYAFRIAVRFEFTSPAEAKNVRMLCERIFNEFVLERAPASAARP